MTDKDSELRVLFLGLDNAGKTTTLKRVMDEPIDTVSPTFGFSIKTFSSHGYVSHSYSYRYTINVCMYCLGSMVGLTL